MPKRNYTARAQYLRDLLENQATQLGKASGFVQRTSKMNAACFCQTMILGSLEEGEKSLNDFAQISQDLGVKISASGLNQRLNKKGVELLKEMLGKSLKMKITVKEKAPFLNSFSDVLLVDSSYISLPPEMKDKFRGIGRASTAGIKLFLNYSYQFGQVKALEVCDGRTVDQSHHIHIDHAQENSLTMFDLGFFNQKLFQQFHDKNAYFIVRYQNQTALYEDNFERLDLAAHLRKFKGNEVGLSLRIGSKVKTPIRLIALRLPKEVAAQRRRQAKEKAKADGRRPTLSAERLLLLDWAIFVTNVPADLLSVEQVTLIYRLRWQIELVFKVWKSSAKLKFIGSFRAERVLCQLYARLTALVLFHSLIAPTFSLYKELSLTKAFLLLKRHALRLIDAFVAHKKQLVHLLKRIDEELLCFALIDKRRKKPNTYQLLVEAGL